MCLSRLTVLSYVVFAGALRYVRYGAGHDVRVTLCGLRCAGTVCVCVCRYGGVTTWVTLCGWWCHGHDVCITLRGKRYVGHGVLAYILELKLNSEVRKSIAHVSVLYNIDVTCLHGNDTTSSSSYMLLCHFPHTIK